MKHLWGYILIHSSCVPEILCEVLYFLRYLTLFNIDPRLEAKSKLLEEVKRHCEGK